MAREMFIILVFYNISKTQENPVKFVEVFLGIATPTIGGKHLFPKNANRFKN